jgi:hypothetical protein
VTSVPVDACRVLRIPGGVRLSLSPGLHEHFFPAIAMKNFQSRSEGVSSQTAARLIIRVAVVQLTLSHFLRREGSIRSTRPCLKKSGQGVMLRLKIFKKIRDPAQKFDRDRAGNSAAQAAVFRICGR